MKIHRIGVWLLRAWALTATAAIAAKALGWWDVDWQESARVLWVPFASVGLFLLCTAAIATACTALAWLCAWAGKRLIGKELSGKGEA